MLKIWKESYSAQEQDLFPLMNLSSTFKEGHYEKLSVDSAKNHNAEPFRTLKSYV